MTSISYQGTCGSFSHQACEACFPEGTYRGCHSFSDALDLVKKGEAEQALIPVDNSIAGRISEMYTLLPESGLHIIGEYFMPINFCLMMPTRSVRGKPSEFFTKEELINWKNREPTAEEIASAIKRITEVYSHPQGLMQCAGFLRRNLPQAKIFETWDTAGAARDLSRERKNHAAAISPATATRYDMTILQENVEDDPTNTTRFLILAKDMLDAKALGEKTITTLIFKTINQPGSLVTALEVFRKYGINLTKLETYMMGSHHSEPNFYVDVEMNPTSDKGESALVDLGKATLSYKLLGTYPASENRN